MALTKAERALLDDVLKSTTELTTAIKGLNGKGGILSHVDEHDHEFGNVHGRIDGADQRHNKLSRNFWLLVGTLVGSGVIGGSLWGALG